MKFLKHLLRLLLCLVIALALVRFGPNIYVRFFGEGNARWFSERFTEALREKNELVVYEIETTGQETVFAGRVAFRNGSESGNALYFSYVFHR